MGGYDPDVGNLQSFCSLLEATNHLLEASTSDLDARGEGLIEAEPDLHEALAGLENGTDGLEKEVTSSETTAAAAVTALGSLVKQFLETRIPAIEAQMEGVKNHSDVAMDERAEWLQSQFDELDKDGFDHFEALLGVEQKEVDRWTEQLEAALAALSEGQEDASQQLERDTQQAMTKLTDATEAAEALHSDLYGRLNANIHELAEELTEQLEKRCSDAGGGMVEWMGEQEKGLRAEADAAREMIRVSAGDLVVVLDEENRQTVEVVEAAGPALEQADFEFEQTYADAVSSGPEVDVIANLRPGIEKAEAEVMDILALMRVLNQP